MPGQERSRGHPRGYKRRGGDEYLRGHQLGVIMEGEEISVPRRVNKDSSSGEKEDGDGLISGFRSRTMQLRDISRIRRMSI